MKLWFCAGIVPHGLEAAVPGPEATTRYEYVAADTEGGARSKCVERHGFRPETVVACQWPERSAGVWGR